MPPQASRGLGLLALPMNPPFHWLAWPAEPQNLCTGSSVITPSVSIRVCGCVRWALFQSFFQPGTSTGKIRNVLATLQATWLDDEEVSSSDLTNL